jgi:hypothetical protein
MRLFASATDTAAGAGCSGGGGAACWLHPASRLPAQAAAMQRIEPIKYFDAAHSIICQYRLIFFAVGAPLTL